MKKARKRMATIIASEECVMGKLNKKDYQNILMHIEDEEVKSETARLGQVPFLQLVDDKLLKLVAQVMTEKQNFGWK